MLSGSALLRVLLLIVCAAALAGLVQAYWSHDGGLPETPLVAAPPDPSGPARRDEAASRVPAPPDPAPLRMREAPPEPVSRPVAPPADTLSPNEPAQAQMPPEPPVPRPPPTPRLPPPPAPVAALPPPAAVEQAATGPAEAAARPAEAEQPPAVGLVDLNTASLEELNGLRGGGAIGRAIIQRRPYASVDELLAKRVLTRSTYLKIKDQLTVR